MSVQRRRDTGAEIQSDGSVHFRVWAPDPARVSLVLEAEGERRCDVKMEPEPDGYYNALVRECPNGQRYWFRLDDDLVADPTSRFQPDGPFGPSQVVDPSAFPWMDSDWKGSGSVGQVLYEMHLGTFTAEGTWRAAMAKLPVLADVGITCVEIMPIAEFPGRFGWGYDGVFPYAPSHLYGTPDDVRAFVERAHQIGLGVLLDVVYNHLGPEGCVFSRYSAAYYSTRHKGEWGDPLNFDGDRSASVRAYFAGNAGYWIDEYRFDGLRLDATQAIHDDSPEHVLAVIAREARAAARERSVILLAENEPQQARLVRPVAQGGYGLDALWNDDFHHSAVVAVTGRREAYYSDHRGAPQEFISAAKYGTLFQGQRYAWQKKPRGSRTDGVPRWAFINFIENHDQVANSGDGSRLRHRTTPGRYRALTALLLLMPGTPMLFQGQEFGSTRPFLFFADLASELADRVREGRAEFVSQFPSLASPEMQNQLAVPHDVATFERCKLEWREREAHPEIWQLHRDLLRLRREFRAFDCRSAVVDGAVIADEAFVLRYLTEAPADERLLIVNFGIDLTAGSIADALVAPPDGWQWTTAWSSEHPAYGGFGTPPVSNPDDGWRIPSHAAIVLRPTESDR